MKKFTLFLFLLMVSITGFSQIEEAIEEIEDAPMMEEAPEPEPSNYNNNTRTSALYQDYQWIHTKYRSGSTQKYGILKNGKKFLPMIFKKGGYGYNSTGRVVLGLDNSYGVYNLDLERWTVPITYKSLKPLKNNYFVAGRGGTYGLIDDNNVVLLPFEFSSLSPIKNLENYVIASKSKGSGYNLRYGIYSIVQGKWTTQPIYRQLRTINTDNYFIVQNESMLYNIVDVNGDIKFKNWYKKLNVSKRVNHYIVDLEGKMGIINDSEEQIVPVEYKYISDRAYNDGSYLAQNKDGKYGCISIDGRVTLPFEYDNIEVQGYNNIGITTQNDKCGIVQVNNGLPYEITTCDYDGIEKSQTAFIIEQGGKFGLMDLYGKLKSQIEFKSLKPINKLIYLAEKKDGFYLMNSKGELLTQTGYQAIEPIYRPQTSRYGSNKNNFSYFKVKLEGNKYGAIDQTGALMPISTFDDITGEINNIFIVKNNKKIGLYSIMKKQLIVPCEYDYITPTASSFYGFKGNNVYSIRYTGKALIRKL